MRNIMHTLCVGTIVAGSALVPNYLCAQQTDNLAREAAGAVDAKDRKSVV